MNDSRTSVYIYEGQWSPWEMPHICNEVISTFERKEYCTITVDRKWIKWEEKKVRNWEGIFLFCCTQPTILIYALDAS